MFDWFEEHPVASGSIAQIHRATLSKRGAHNSSFLSGTLVAVKVCWTLCKVSAKPIMLRILETWQLSASSRSCVN